ncbi:MAG: hypothetical protein M1828_000346 [Chrysothrix sp. TS-e1954]|nr:MAG: hypothetical protein M1828_000346 [Chrysothrix sp. TS-e1954]
MTTKRAEKASNYVSQLYEARCSRNWQALPELARKVDKHAQGRRGLTASSRAEAALFGPERPAAGVQDKLRSQLASILTEDTSRNETLDVAVTLATVSYRLKEYRASLKTTPESLSKGRKPVNGIGQASWEAVCVVQGTLVRGLSLEALDNHTEARDTYRSIVPYLSEVTQLPRLCIALQRWTEELLVHMCLYFSTPRASHSQDPRSIEQIEDKKSHHEVIPTFHVLSQLLQRQSDKLLGQRSLLIQHNAATLWKVYYASLSETVRTALTTEEFELGVANGTEESRHQRWGQLKRAEKGYETILLQHTRFPKAGEPTPEINEWIDLVMGNWEAVSGPNWRDEDLGAGGKATEARNVLDILYRAVTKTFHSTRILRSLFAVHAFLGEFRLAFKAFDTYVEIASKGKARAEKSGSSGIESDDDEMVVRLAVEAIRVSVRFGDMDAAEKAYDIGVLMSNWQFDPENLNSPQSPTSPGQSKKVSTAVPPKFTNISTATLGLAYRAIGISQAHWARYTYDASLRETLQHSSVHSLRVSLRPQFCDTNVIEGLYALGVVLAELRRIPEAVAVIREGLGIPTSESTLAYGDKTLSTIDELHPGNALISANAQKLLPLWSLLALLFSALEDFDAARVACAVALGSCPASLDLSMPPSEYSAQDKDDDSIEALERLGERMPHVASIWELDAYDKQTIVELRITQLTLLGLCEGPNAALKASNRLVALYSQLFGTGVSPATGRAPEAQSVPPPKSSRGTIRSFFGRPPSSYKSRHGDRPPSSVGSTRRHLIVSRPPTLSSRPATMTNGGPSIQVIDEEGESKAPSSNSRHSFINRHPDGEHRKLRKSQSLRRRASSNLQDENKNLATVIPEITTNGHRESEPMAVNNIPQQDGSEEKEGDSDLQAIDNEVDKRNSTRKERHMSIYDFLKKEAPPSTNQPPDPECPTPTIDNGALSHLQQPADGSSRPTSSSSRHNASQPLSPVAHNISHDTAPPPTGHDGQPPRQDTRLTVPHPKSSSPQQLHTDSPHTDPFLTLQSHRHRTTLLTKIWLYIASLYISLSPPLHSSALSAITEAQSIVRALEEATITARGHALVADFRRTGWGGGKAVDELWADISAAKAQVLLSEEKPHDAMEELEQAVNFWPDHPAATIALSNIMLDIYEEKIPLSKPEPGVERIPPPAFIQPKPVNPEFKTQPLPHPFELMRLANRDRAYGLLSSLTKLGSGWDNSEAWLALGRAYEASGQLDEAAEAWVWCCKLEESRFVGVEGRRRLVL